MPTSMCLLQLSEDEIAALDEHPFKEGEGLTEGVRESPVLVLVRRS
jgi:hypothetical protein